MNITKVLTPDEITMLYREELISKEEARRLLVTYGVTIPPEEGAPTINLTIDGKTIASALQDKRSLVTLRLA